LLRKIVTPTAADAVACAILDPRRSARREDTVIKLKETVMHTIDTLRTYATHETGYWAAQRAGFAVIKRIEQALRDRDSWAGRYTGWLNPNTEEYEDIDDCSGQFEDAHRLAVDLAADACLGNAHGIIIAQGRTDEAAQLIRDAYDRDTVRAKQLTTDELVQRQAMLRQRMATGAGMIAAFEEDQVSDTIRRLDEDDAEPFYEAGETLYREQRNTIAAYDAVTEELRVREAPVGWATADTVGSA
jgi:hypothetical protein